MASAQYGGTDYLFTDLRMLGLYIRRHQDRQGHFGLTCKLPWGGYPKSLHSLNMKNGRSDTPLS